MLFDKNINKESSPDEHYGLPEVDMKPVSRRETQLAAAFEKSKAAPSAIKDAPLAGPPAPSASGKFPLQAQAIKHAGTTSSPGKASGTSTTHNDATKKSSTPVATILISALILVLIWVVIFLKSNGIFPFEAQAPEAMTALNEATTQQDNSADLPPAALDDDEAWASTELDQVEEIWEANEKIENESGGELEALEELPETITLPLSEIRIENVTASNNQFYMITGSHPNLNAATQDAKNFEAEVVYILFPREGRQENYRIAVGRFAALGEATDALSDFRSKFGESVWVLRY
jgi:hypothetical protein